MKHFTFLLLLTIPASIFLQTIYCLQKDSAGVSFGKINNINGQYSRISNTICYDVLWSFFNPVNNQYLFKGQVYKDQNMNKLYTIKANDGQVVNSLDIIDGNEGLRNWSINSC